MTALALLFAVREDFRPLWTKVDATVRKLYYARRTRKKEMERLLAKYAPRARAATDREVFERTVNAMTEEFGDSHFEFFSDRDQGFYLMNALVDPNPTAMPEIGAWFRRAPDGYTVGMVLDGGAADRAGLRVGDLVTRIDGGPFTPIVAFASRIGSDARLTFRRGNATLETSVRPSRTVGTRMFLDATLASRRTISQGGRQFGYLHLWTQAGAPFRKALEDALRDARDRDGFVLDLRGGFGGYIQGFEEAVQAYPKPVVVVIDGGSRSAKELLAFALQRSHRATLVGERTAGDVLGAMPIRLEEWAYLEVPAVDYKVGGVRLEGRGVQPDVEVPPGGDPVARAVAILGGSRSLALRRHDPPYASGA